MNTQTISVAYVNPPKNPKGPGSIKDTEGRYWKLWTKDTPLDQFAVGQSYDIVFETDQYQGKDQHTIKRATPRGGAVAPNNGNGQAPRQPTAPTDAERMFTCSLLNAFIQAGKIDLSPGELTSSTNLLRSVWQETFGAK